MESDLPAMYQMSPAKFSFRLEAKRSLPASAVDILDLTFPSPVKSIHASNNTVHARYFRPHGDGPFPAVILLEILQGGEELAEGLGMYLAQNKIAALFVRMSYYGPRRPPGERIRLMSPDIDQTTENVRQTIMDCRYATAWLGSRPEIDPEQLGICGTSMGSFLSALTGAMEPRLKKVALVLSGGSLVEVYYELPIAAPFRRINELLGGSKQKLKNVIDKIDPITYAGYLKGRDVLIIAAKNDSIVPPRAAQLLWEASGKQKILWIDSDHYTAALYIVPMLRAIHEHFQPK